MCVGSHATARRTFITLAANNNVPDLSSWPCMWNKGILQTLKTYKKFQEKVKNGLILFFNSLTSFHTF